MIYLASPYSHPNPVIRNHRFTQARQFVIHCLQFDKIAIFSPIVYWHDMAKSAALPTDAAFWLTFDLNVLRRSEALFVLQIPGWEESQGVKVELGMAKILAIPTIHFDSNFKNLTAAGNADNQNGPADAGSDSSPKLQ